MIDTKYMKFEKFNYPVGEPNITIVNPNLVIEKIFFDFQHAHEIVDLGILVHTLRSIHVTDIYLDMPYLPFSRQDRPGFKGNNFSLQWFCEYLNSMNFTEIRTLDCHSDVTQSLLKNLKNITQDKVFEEDFPKEPFYFVSPDAGAMKKLLAFPEMPEFAQGIIECRKIRDFKTGEIIKTKVYDEDFCLKDKDLIILDDICDGGRTFVEIAKELKLRQPRSITLMVTHGFFTKGLRVFDGLIDKIITHKGEVK